MRAEIPMREKRKRVPRADTEYVDAIELRARWTIGPAAAQQTDVVTVRRESSEDLVQVNLSAAGQRVLAILPVHEQDAHYMRPMRRASASSTPFTNFALLSVP